MAIRTSTAAGNWGNSGTWVGGNIPGSGDTAVINHAVTVAANQTVGASLSTSPIAKPTVSATGGGSSGGSLPAGAYRCFFSYVSANGETSVSAESSAFTIAAGNIPRVTIPALPAGVASANLYLTQAAGAANSERRYKTGITTTTIDLSSASWENGTVAFASAALPVEGSAILVNTAGSLTVNAGIQLTVKGDIKIGSCLFTLSAGSILEFDSSGSASAAAVYDFRQGTATAQTNSRLLASGTSGSHVTIRSNASGAVARLLPNTFTSLVGVSKWDLTYVDFLRMGNATNNCLTASNTGASLTHLILDHCVFDTCGVTELLGGTVATSGWSITNCTWKNGVYRTNPDGTARKNPLYMTCTTQATGVTRLLDHCSFDHPPSLCANGSTVTNNVFYKAWDNNTSANFASHFASFTGNFIRIYYVSSSGEGNSQATISNVDGNYVYWDAVSTGSEDAPVAGSGPNAHYFNAGGVGGAQSFSNNVVEYNGVGIVGDVIKTFTANNTVTVDGNLVLPNGIADQGLGDRDTSGCLITMFSTTPSTAVIKARHNTGFTGSGGLIHINEGGSQPNGTLDDVRSNLAWRDTGVSYAAGAGPGCIVNSTSTVSSNTNDPIPQARLDYNCMWNGQDGYAWTTYHGSMSGIAKGYNINEDSNAGANPFGQNDVVLTGSPGPNFVDDTRNFKKWAVTILGASGTNAQKITAGINALRAFNETGDPNYNAAAVISGTSNALYEWVRAGFRPQNSVLDNTAHDGGDIGAMSVLLAPPTAGTVSTGSITSSSITPSVTSASGGTSPYSYQLQRAPDVSGSPGTWADIGSPLTGQTGAATFPANTGLSASTTYWFRVVVTDAASQTATSDAVSATTDAAAPALASGTLSKTGSDADSIQFAVTAATGGTAPYSYKLYRHTSSGFTPPGTGTLIETSSDLTLVDTTPTPGTAYYYRLVTTDSAGSPASVVSNEVFGTILVEAAVGGAPINKDKFNWGSLSLNDVIPLTIAAETPAGEITDLDQEPTFRIYKDMNETPVYTGTMAIFDDDDTTGVYRYQLFLTEVNGFAAGSFYLILYSTLLDGKTAYDLEYFRIGIPSPVSDSPGVTTLLLRLNQNRANLLDNLTTLAAAINAIIVGTAEGVEFVGSLDSEAVDALQNGLATSDDLANNTAVINQTVLDETAALSDELDPIQENTTAIRATTDQLAHMIEADGPDFRFDANALELAPVTESIDIDETAIALAVDTLLSAEHGDGQWDAAGATVEGENTVTILVRDSVSLVGLPGIRITIRDDSGTLVDQKTTGYGGYTTFALDDGDYTLSSLPRPGYSSVASQAFTVDGDEAVTVNLVAITPTAITGNGAKYLRTVEFYIYNLDRTEAVSGVTIRAELLDVGGAIPQILFDSEPLTVVTNSEGYASMNLVMSNQFINGKGTYRITYGSKQVEVKIPYGKKTPINITEVIGGQGKLGEI